MSGLFLEGETQNSCPWGEIVAPISWIEYFSFLRSIYFSAAVSLRYCQQAFSSRLAVAGGGCPSLRCVGFSSGGFSCREHRLEAHGISSGGAQAQWLHGMGDIPGPGIALVSQGRFLNHWTTREAIRIHILRVYSFLKVFFFLSSFIEIQFTYHRSIHLKCIIQ